MALKTRSWIFLIVGILFVCLALSMLLWLPREAAPYAQVYSGGQLLHTLDLSVERQVTVTTQAGTNVITVKDGAVAVTQADCPDGYCMRRGYCKSGAQIVCLPHGLVIQFVQEVQVDGVSG